MNFPTPADSNDSTETETETETAEIYDGRHDDQEAYWAVIDTERFLQRLCLTHGVGVDNSGNRPYARYNDAADQSPIAEHGLFYYRQKTEMKDDLAEKRESGELDSDQNLPNYKDQFGEPEWDHHKVTAETAEDFGLDPEYVDDDETIFLPAEYEPETDDDGNLIVWYDEKAKDFDLSEVLAVAAETDGIGEKTLESLEANLKNAL